MRTVELEGVGGWVGKKTTSGECPLTPERSSLNPSVFSANGLHFKTRKKGLLSPLWHVNRAAGSERFLLHLLHGEHRPTEVEQEVSWS